MNKFVLSYGKHFFLGNTIREINKPSLSITKTILQSSFIQTNLKTKFQFINPILKSKLTPINKIKPITNNASLQVRSFSSSGVLKFVRIYNNNYNKNINVLKQASIFGVIFFATTTLLTPYLFQYTPLSHFARHPSHMIYSLIGINLLVFGSWRLPQFWRILNRYFLLEKDVLYSKWSIIGSAFSHQEVWHLGMNMLALYSFGISLASMIGSSNFLTLYLNSAVFASIVSIAYPILFRIPITAPSLGASGALFGIFGTFAYLIPQAKIMLFVFPIPGGASVAFLGSVLWNIAGCVMRWGSFDYAAHLGGSLFGVLYGIYISQKVKQQRARRMRSFGW